MAGVDPEQDVLENPFLDEAKIIDLSTNIIPYEDNTFDVVFSCNVMEHIQMPDVMFHEIMRVLKPGGVFVSKTTNKWHYATIIARGTPTWFHTLYNRLRGRRTVDTFPTVYKCNSKAAIEKGAEHAGFRVKKIQLIEGRPEYLRIMPIMYFCGYLYERLVNSTEVLAPFRCGLVFELEKP